MKLYFGNTVTTVTTIMILVLLGFIGESIAKRTKLTTGDAEVCSFWHMDWLYAALQRQGMGWIKRFRTRLTEAVHREYSRLSASRI